MDWMNPTISASAEEREAEMPGLIARLLCGCARELPMLKRRPHPASKFRAENALGRLNLMRRSKLIRR